MSDLVKKLLVTPGEKFKLRDVDPGVRDVPDVTLLDLDDLKDFAQRSAERRRREIGKIREILSAEIERYRNDRAAREVAPLVTALRSLGEDVRVHELDRFKAKTANLPRTTEAERMVIQRIGQDVFRDALMDYWGSRVDRGRCEKAPRTPMDG